METDYNGMISKLTNILFENACLSFRNTGQYNVLLENHNKKLKNYESALSEDQTDLINDYLTALNELNAAEAEYIYLKGVEDCFNILKRIGAV